MGLDMSAIDDLIDLARSKCDRPSDRALAERLKMSPNSISVWRKGGKITDEHLALLIELSNSDPSIALQVRAEQASSKAEIRLWNHMLTRLASAALLGVMYIM
ncbi:MAG: hypothetical protein DI584_03155 [Stenotrophomonas sp.]|jgi:hypothetical protein|nr:MAG: hypothetical protein DI584_03155 [Stenotrophomonas sp.]